jgi:hypothetical protein
VGIEAPDRTVEGSFAGGEHLSQRVQRPARPERAGGFEPIRSSHDDVDLGVVSGRVDERDQIGPSESGHVARHDEDVVGTGTDPLESADHAAQRTLTRPGVRDDAEIQWFEFVGVAAQGDDG